MCALQPLVISCALKRLHLGLCSPHQRGDSELLSGRAHRFAQILTVSLFMNVTDLREA